MLLNLGDRKVLPGSSDEKVIVRSTCMFCKKENNIEVNRAQYERWIGGELIQRAFPDLTPDQRESVQTGIHPKCWEGLR